MIELEYLRDWVYGPFLATLTLLASFLWHKITKDRKELMKEISDLRIDHSTTKQKLSEMKVCVGRLDERVKALEK